MDKGLLIERITKQGTYTYNIVPMSLAFDVFETSLPDSVAKERISVNLNAFMTGLYEVEYKWQRIFTNVGSFIDKGIITNVVKKHTIDINQPTMEIGEYKQITSPQVVDMEFIASITQLSATGAALAKRRLSTQVATCIQSDGKCNTVFINLPAIYNMLRAYPNRIKGIILTQYKVPIIVFNSITEEEFKEQVIGRITENVREFMEDYTIMTMPTHEESEE